MHDLGLKTSVQNFEAFVRCTLMGNQPWPQFQNGIRERSIVEDTMFPLIKLFGLMLSYCKVIICSTKLNISGFLLGLGQTGRGRHLLNDCCCPKTLLVPKISNKTYNSYEVTQQKVL